MPLDVTLAVSPVNILEPGKKVETRPRGQLTLLQTNVCTSRGTTYLAEGVLERWSAPRGKLQFATTNSKWTIEV